MRLGLTALFAAVQLASVAAGAATVGAQGVASDQPGLQLRIEAADPVRIIVVNEGAPCRLSSLADGAVTIAAVQRDGQPTEPFVTAAYYHDGLAATRAEFTEVVPTGGSLELRSATGDDGALHSVSFTSSGPALRASYPLTEPGTYQIHAQLNVPHDPADLADACVGGAAPAVFDLVVPGGTAGPAAATTAPGSGRGGGAAALAAFAAGAAAIALAGGAIVLVRRRGRGPALVIVGAGLAALLVGADTTVAEAKVEVSPGASAGFKGAVDACLGKIFDAGDPAGVFARAANAGKTVRIEESVFDSATTPDSLADAANPAKGSDSVIVWNPSNRSAYSDGVARDPCSVLYHELSHGADAATGTDNGGPCGASGISVAEVRATTNENALRTKMGLPPRTTYGGKPLPQGADPCKSAPRRPGRGPRRDDCAAASCGSANGDPHLRTFDQTRYDLQTVGEYVLARAQDGDFEVHVRHSPFAGSRQVSVVSAAAVRLDGVTVEFRAGAGDRLAVLVDGEPASLRGVGERRGGLELGVEPTSRGDGAWLVGSDGTVVLATALGGWGLDVEVNPAASRRGKLVGLLGNFDGTPAGDLVHRDGLEVVVADGALPSPEALARFGDSWRLENSESLFDYASGESTATFTDRTFPDTPPDPPKGALEVAEVLCRVAVGEASPEYPACVLDVAMTRLQVFALAAADRAETASASAAGPAGGGSPTTAPTIVVAVGTETTLGPGQRLDFAGDLRDAGQVDAYAVAGMAGQVAYLQVRDVGNVCGSGIFDHKIEVIAPSGRTVLTGWDCGIDPGRLVLEETGVHQIRVSGDAAPTGPYRFALIDSGPDQRFELPFGRPMGAGEPGPGAGMVERPGTQDRYRFTGEVGQVVYLQTDDLGAAPDQGCKGLFDIKLEVLAPSGRSLLTSWNCSTDGGRLTLTESGEYTVVASGDAVRTGPYRFVLHDSGPDQTFELSVGTVVGPDRPGPGAGRIEQPGTQDRYRITATAGSRAVLRGLKPPTCTDRYAHRLTLTAPSGAALLTTWTCSLDEAELLFPETGTYLLTVEGDGQRTGTYQFDLASG